VPLRPKDPYVASHQRLCTRTGPVSSARQHPQVLNESFDIHAPRLVLSVYECVTGGNIMGRIVIPNPPHYPTISLKMVNFRKPVVASGTGSACASQDSEGHQTNLNLPVSQVFWLLVDGFYMCACSLLGISPLRCVASQLLIYSWEYFITLDLEWNVIRGRRPHRWTIWVCTSHSPFFFLFCDKSVANNLICSSGRSTPLPDWPLSHL
jgi:hypothetical protein